MKVIIAGSRHIHWAVASNEIAAAVEDSGFEITEVVSGTALGIDQGGERWAANRLIPITQFYPEWEEYGKAAGPIRNEDMAIYADALILVWDGKSPGSASMLRLAKKHGLRIHERVLVHKTADGKWKAGVWKTIEEIADGLERNRQAAGDQRDQSPSAPRAGHEEDAEGTG